MAEQIQILNNGETLYNFRNIINDNFTLVQENVLTKSQVTNCLLQVPQKINVQVDNGTLTLKAGSRVIIPNGFEADGITPKFGYEIIENDIVKEFLATNGSLVCCTVGSPWEPSMQRTFDYFTNGFNLFSQPTPPTSTNAHVFWYDTSINKIKASMDFGATWSDVNSSLPICLIHSDVVGVMKSIPQVFHSFGYIGSTIWVDEGVKGLAPDGRNGDGSLNNIVWEAPHITVITMETITTHQQAIIAYNPNEPVGGHKIGVISTQSFRYDDGQNRNYDIDNEWAYTPIATATIIDGVIKSFAPKLPFRAVDSEQVVKLYNFKSDQWVYDSVLDLYVLNTGQINRVGVSVFMKTDLGNIATEFVDIVVNSQGVLTLHSLDVFDGYLVFT